MVNPLPAMPQKKWQAVPSRMPWEKVRATLTAQCNRTASPREMDPLGMFSEGASKISKDTRMTQEDLQKSIQNLSKNISNISKYHSM